MFPAATARRPDASSIAAVRLVTVVFPFVPVTATIGAVARSAARSISLRTATRLRACGNDRRMRFRDQRARHDELDLADRGAVPVVRRRVDDARERRNRLDARPVGVAAGPVVGHDQVPALAVQAPGNRFAGGRQADDQRAHQSIPNRRKSA